MDGKMIDKDKVWAILMNIDVDSSDIVDQLIVGIEKGTLSIMKSTKKERDNLMKKLINLLSPSIYTEVFNIIGELEYENWKLKKKLKEIDEK